LDPADLDEARETLLSELRQHALVLGEVTLSSGQTASYYVDARRALLRPAGFRAAGELIAAAARRLGAEAVGGPVMAAIPLACAAIAVPAGADDYRRALSGAP
jgi:orotate phosphoribosyltransferase